MTALALLGWLVALVGMAALMWVVLLIAIVAVAAQRAVLGLVAFWYDVRRAP